MVFFFEKKGKLESVDRAKSMGVRKCVHMRKCMHSIVKEINPCVLYLQVSLVVTEHILNKSASVMKV